MKKLHHPYIVELYNVAETADYLYLVMENGSGGNLLDYLHQHKNAQITEDDARDKFGQIVSALLCLNQNNIAHR